MRLQLRCQFVLAAMVLALSSAGCSSDNSGAQAAACNALVNSAPVVTGTVIATAAPTPTGGTISDGTYVLSAITAYTGSQTHTRAKQSFSSRPPDLSKALPSIHLIYQDPLRYYKTVHYSRNKQRFLHVSPSKYGVNLRLFRGAALSADPEVVRSPYSDLSG